MPLDETFWNTERFDVAQPLTVRVRGIMVTEDFDWRFRGNNDLMIVTTSQFDSEPPVERLNYLGHEDELGWQGDFFDEVVLSIRDVKDKRLTLRVQAYDVDGVDPSLVETVHSLASEAAVLFPQLGPLSALVSPSISTLFDLVENLDDHDRIVDEQVTLELASAGTGHNLLQPGYYVCFSRDVDVDDGFTLGRDLRVVTADGRSYDDGSYAVLELSRDHVDEPARELDQRVAKLVAELNGKGQTQKVALDFLRETLDVYTAYKKLARIRELQSKATMSPDEKALLDELLADEEVVRILGD